MLLIRVNTIVFGGTEGIDDEDSDHQNAIMKYFVSVLSCLFCCQAWKCTKWVEIRYKTRDMAGELWIFRIKAYFGVRESEDETTMAIQTLLKNNEGRNKLAIKKKID